MDYIIPYRASTEDRKMALAASLQYLRDKPVNPIVVEDHDDGLFNKGRLVNRGFKASRSPIVWIADNDFIIDESAFDRAIKHLSSVSVYQPFVKKIYNVPLEVFQTYANGAVRTENFPIRGGLWLFSGVTAITREAFVKIGGYDESFIGWGGEDYAMARVTFMMKIPTYSDDLPAYHFAHERLPNDTCKHSNYKANVKLWKEYEKASEEEMAVIVTRNRQRNFL